MKAVRPTEAAEDEFREHIRWYENESAGLGERLWVEIQAAVTLIATHPSIGEVVPRTRVRRVRLRHFPFLLVYREHADLLEVIALAHMSRKAKYWRRRIS